jgi:transcriptional antiterminator NusG
MTYFIDEQSEEELSAEMPADELDDSSTEETVDDSAVEESASQVEEETSELKAEETDSEEVSEEVDESVVEESSPEVIEETSEPEVEETVSEEISEAADESTVEKTAEAIDDGRLWFVIHCYSGYENKVRHNLEQRIESMDMKNYIFDVVVPIEEEIEVKDGKRKIVERRVFPGYILVNMIMSEESWYVVRNTPGVTSFVGMGNEPIPLRPEEVAKIIKRMEADAPRIRLTFRKGERVRITDGPFNEFRGTVDEIDMDRAKVRVMVNFFGRETPVELDFLQVEKA